MLFVASSLLLVGVVVSSDTDDLRSLVESLAEQNTKLASTTDQLGADISQLQQQYDTLVASTATQRDKQQRWRRETAKQLESLAGRWGLSTAVSTQRRGLSSGTCTDPDAPELFVKGVCSCTEGLLVEGRNITKELDTFFEAAATTTTTSTRRR